MHRHEPTDASILSADGLAAYASLKREEEQERAEDKARGRDERVREWGSGATPSYRAGLPAFGGWDRTSYDGSLSGDARGATHEQPYSPPPPPFPAQPSSSPHPPYAPASQPRYSDPYEAEDERGDLAGGWTPDPEDDGEKGEFHYPAGTYQHGVGFNSHDGAARPHPPSKSAAGEKLKDRLANLERKFGSSTSSSFPPFAGIPPRDGARAMRARQREEKKEAKALRGVDSKGRLVTQGRRKRATLRWAQGIGAVVVGCGSIGAALLTHPPNPPPPFGSAPLWAMYILPFLSLVLTLYMHVIRPYRFKKRSSAADAAGVGGFPSGGGMLVPILPGKALPSGGGGCCGFGRSKQRVPRGGTYQPSGPMAVNLVVDPSLFAALSPAPAARQRPSEEEERKQRGGRRKREKRRRARAREREKAARDEEGLVSSSSELDSSDFSSSSSDAWSDTADPATQRKGILSHLASEQAWLAARKWGTKVAAADNLYNLALAFSVLTAVVFLASFALGCIDLSRSKALNPRLRQQRLRPVGSGGEGVV
ncbi:hypothetical protein JCM10213v2_006704 [Rhodosporidiobolus nylandii]